MKCLIPNRRRLTVAGAMTALIAVLAACSGGSPSSQSTSSVSSYQQIVRATCGRMKSDVTNTGVQTTTNANGESVVQAGDIISVLQRTLPKLSDEFNALYAEPVPPSLASEYQKVRHIQPQYFAAASQEENAIKAGLHGPVTQGQIDQAIGPQLSKVNELGTQLNDAMTALAGSACEVSTG
jgi:hypothetical protein